MRCPILQYPTELATKHEAKAYDQFQKHNPHDAFYIRTFAQLKEARPEEAEHYLDLTYASSVSSRKMHQRKAVIQLQRLVSWVSTIGGSKFEGRRRNGSREDQFTLRFSTSTLAFMQ